jgi:hypothetical protein
MKIIAAIIILGLFGLLGYGNVQVYGYDSTVTLPVIVKQKFDYESEYGCDDNSYYFIGKLFVNTRSHPKSCRIYYMVFDVQVKGSVKEITKRVTEDKYLRYTGSTPINTEYDFRKYDLVNFDMIRWHLIIVLLNSVLGVLFAAALIGLISMYLADDSNEVAVVSNES